MRGKHNDFLQKAGQTSCASGAHNGESEETSETKELTCLTMIYLMDIQISSYEFLIIFTFVCPVLFNALHTHTRPRTRTKPRQEWQSSFSFDLPANQKAYKSLNRHGTAHYLRFHRDSFSCCSAGSVGTHQFSHSKLNAVSLVPLGPLRRLQKCLISASDRFRLDAMIMIVISGAVVRARSMSSLVQAHQSARMGA